MRKTILTVEFMGDTGLFWGAKSFTESSFVEEKELAEGRGCHSGYRSLPAKSTQKCWKKTVISTEGNKWLKNEEGGESNRKEGEKTRTLKLVSLNGS